jgi:predicted alpha/beta hydrolase family esterase
MTSARVLLLPGWQNSGPGHWQTLWETQFGDLRVEQHDWMQPLRGDWITRLEEVVQQQPGPVLLAAHSLGCHLVAAWAAASRSTQRVQHALLVAPPDVAQPDLPPQLHRWTVPVLRPLPFAATLVASSNDPFCSLDAAGALARHWGAAFHNIGPRGHINADSGLGDWPEGRAQLNLKDTHNGNP